MPSALRRPRQLLSAGLELRPASVVADADHRAERVDQKFDFRFRFRPEEAEGRGGEEGPGRGAGSHETGRTV